jgi:hypothetical protein
MNDLSPKARAVVEAGRDPGVFTPADRDRIRRGLHLRLATLGAVTTTAGTAAAMSITAKIALVTAVATVLGGGVASFWALRGRAPAPGAAAGHSSPIETPAVEAPITKTIQVTGDATAAPTPPRPATAARRSFQTRSERPAAAGVPATEDHTASLDSELGLLRQAREDLRTGSPGTAYQRLVDHERQYGKGPLWQERQALSAIALCQWRPGPQAQVRADEFLRNAPQSPLADRVRSVCRDVNAAAK